MSSAKIKKTLDRLAYASLVLDICIAAVTSLGLLGSGGTEKFLLPISYLLTIVVILSVIMFVVLLMFKVKERQLPPRS
jgi:hypothetical protein